MPREFVVTPPPSFFDEEGREHHDEREFQRAWHANVERNPDGTIKRSANNEMRVRSIDLGFMQFNVTPELSPLPVSMTEAAVTTFVESMFDTYPHLADPVESAEAAYELWQRRGFQPWYAYKPGTVAWRLKKRYGAIAFAQWLVNSFVGKDPETGKVPKVGYL